MEQEAIAERHRLAGLECHVAGAVGFLLEIIDAERVGGDQSVIAGVPPSGMSGVFGVIKDRDTGDLAFDVAPVVDPRGAFAPHRFAGHAFAVDRLSARRCGCRVFSSVLSRKLWMGSDAHRALLGVTDDDVTGRRDPGNFDNRCSGLRRIFPNVDGALVAANGFTVGGVPIILGDDLVAVDFHRRLDLGSNVFGLFAFAVFHPKSDRRRLRRACTRSIYGVGGHSLRCRRP